MFLSYLTYKNSINISIVIEIVFINTHAYSASVLNDYDAPHAIFFFRRNISWLDLFIYDEPTDHVLFAKNLNRSNTLVRWSDLDYVFFIHGSTQPKNTDPKCNKNKKDTNSSPPVCHVRLVLRFWSNYFFSSRLKPSWLRRLI
jgi:hypothetical protein